MSRTSTVSRMINSRNPGRMREQITLYAPHIARDAVGSPSVTSWVEGDTVWAEVVEMPEQSYTQERNRQDRPVKNYRVKIRHQTSATATWLAYWDGRWLSIESINTLGLGKESQVLLCREWVEPTAPEIYRVTSDGSERVTADGSPRIL